ncbi:hypothetical protein [Microbacterium esteraromaticum]|uniref:hypothetical protein n=1 Tax=Microbacterium esteraromaticum TaxID=57043 RepID=UPI0021753D34|nr:hypothetical protein [Microbacterium esteraromaticum]
MAIFTGIDAQVAALRDLLGDDVTVGDLAARMSSFSGEKLVDAMTAAAALVQCAERIGIIGAGIVATRSRREVRQDGLAQSRGHRSPAALVQEITGTSHADAQRQVRLGQSILDAEAAAAGESAAAGPDAADKGNTGFGTDTTEGSGAGAGADTESGADGTGSLVRVMAPVRMPVCSPGGEPRMRRDMRRCRRRCWRGGSPPPSTTRSSAAWATRSTTLPTRTPRGLRLPSS